MTGEHLSYIPLRYNHINLEHPDVKDQAENIEDLVLETQDIVVMRVDNPATTIGAFQDTQLVGFAEVATDGHVNLIVHPGFQGRGIGKNLLEQAIEWSKSQNHPQLVASVKQGSASERLFQAAGFVTKEGDRPAADLTSKVYTLNLE
jgi:GNAT superfamily N-acetyltransferase